jgi:hypothetical protein
MVGEAQGLLRRKFLQAVTIWRHRWRDRALSRADIQTEDIMAKLLAQFSITRSSDGDYLMTLESDEGETVEFEASYEQLDLINETIDEQLNADEDDALEVDEEEDDVVVADEDDD